MKFWTHRYTVMLVLYIAGVFGGLAATTFASFWLMLRHDAGLLAVFVQMAGIFATLTAGRWYLPLLVWAFRLEARDA